MKAPQCGESVRQDTRIWRLKRVIGPDGRYLTLADLPPTNLKHWLPYHKARIVTTVRGGLIGADEVCRRYQLTLEELKTWVRAFEIHGVEGLHVRRTSRLTRHTQ